MGKITDPNTIIKTLASATIYYLNAALAIMFIIVLFKTLIRGAKNANEGLSSLGGGKKKIKSPAEKKPSQVTGFAGQLFPNNTGGSGIKATEAHLWWNSNSSAEKVHSYEISIETPARKTRISKLIVVNKSYDHTTPLIIRFVDYPSHFSGLPNNPTLIFSIRAINSVKKGKIVECVATQDTGGTPIRITEFIRIRKNINTLTNLKSNFIVLTNKTNTAIVTGYIPFYYNIIFHNYLQQYIKIENELNKDFNAIKSDLTKLLPSQFYDFISSESSHYSLRKTIKKHINNLKIYLIPP